jgi:GNAT superfamily N-acetyltransferase
MRTLPLALTVRPAAAQDAEALGALIDRCSPDTLYRRFHGAGERSARRELARVADPTPTHRSFVAVSPGGEIRGTATLAWGHDGSVEAAFLVEDAWFRRGVGRALYAALAREARRACLATVTATVQADNERAIRFLLSVADGARSRYAGGAEVAVTIPVSPARAGAAPAEEAA